MAKIGHIILLLGIVMVMAACQQTAAPEQNVENNMPETEDNTPPEMEEENNAPSDSGDEEVKVFRLTGENFIFMMDGEENPELRVQEGDRVRIEFESSQGFHDWVLDQFDAATEQVMPEDGMTSVEFVADQAGSYEYYCSVGSHRAMGMWGNFVVEEAE